MTRRAVVQEVDQVVVLAQVVEKQSKALMVALPTTLAASRLRRSEPIHNPVLVTMAQ